MTGFAGRKDPHDVELDVVGRRAPERHGRHPRQLTAAPADQHPRHYFGDPGGLYTAISAQAHLINAEFCEPLPVNEAVGIARSIHKWIVTRSRMWQDGFVVYEATFSTIQARRRRRKSGQARRGNKTIVCD